MNYVDDVVAAAFSEQKMSTAYVKAIKRGEVKDASEDAAHRCQGLSLLCKASLEAIERGQHFTLEDRKNLSLVIGSLTLSELVDRIKGMRLPYPSMTLSITSEFLPIEVEAADKTCPAMFVVEEVSKDLIAIIIWAKLLEVTPGSKPVWCPVSDLFFMSLDGPFKQRKDKAELGERLLKDPEGLKDWDDILFCYDPENPSETAVVELIVSFVAFVQALNTKGIVVHTFRPPKKRSNRPDKKYPLVEYKVLKIGGVSTKSTEGQMSATEKMQEFKRLHLCRGHMKRYGADRPLFGKISGTFFFSPHWRGDKNKGVLLKDYQYGNEQKSTAPAPVLPQRKEGMLGKFKKALTKFVRRLTGKE